MTPPWILVVIQSFAVTPRRNTSYSFGIPFSILAEFSDIRLRSDAYDEFACLHFAELQENTWKFCGNVLFTAHIKSEETSCLAFPYGC